MKIIERLQGKRIVIWGYGREGKSTEQFIANHVKAKSVEIVEGSYDELKNKECDLIIKSPGIRFDGKDERMESQTSLFLATFREQIVGITGTKGKSTTSALLYTCLRGCGKKTILVGNIGFPCLDFYDEIEEDTIIVFEMSCHQLQRLEISPKVAVFLNLYEDHLDYYDTKEKYGDAKANILRYQTKTDICVVGKNVPYAFCEAQCKVIDIDHTNLSFQILLEGAHNRFNAEIVYFIATSVYACNIEKAKIEIASFKGLRHRLEKIGIMEGVEYYDDSISTISESAIHSILSIENAKAILIGGMDRGISYEKLEKFIRSREDIWFVCMYASGKRIFDELGKAENCVYFEDLEKAVAFSKTVTKAGDACILSPAAASYGYFKNFEERGDAFSQIVGLS